MTKEINASFKHTEWRILHTATHVLLPYRFETRPDAEKWLTKYLVEDNYKKDNYQIVED